MSTGGFPWSGLCVALAALPFTLSVHWRRRRNKPTPPPTLAEA